MRARLCSKLLKSQPVQPHAEEMGLESQFSCAGEVHPFLIRIEAHHAINRPIPICQLSDLSAVQVVEV